MRDAPPLAGLRLALVGPGRVGSTLAAWAAGRGARLVRVAGRRPEAAEALAARLGGEAVALDRFESADCGLLLLAVADGALAEVAGTLAERPQAPVVLHTSGSLGASVLAPLAPGSGAGSATGSFHPLKAFPRPLPEPSDLARAAGTFYALDGTPEAVALGERLAAAFGGASGVVPEAARDVYHLGATVAAGGVATLLVSAGESTERLGLEPGLPESILRGYLALARSAVDALEAATAGLRPADGLGPAAITGPLARGDHQTFLREMESLRETLGTDDAPAPGRLALLCRLGLETVRLTAGDAEARTLEAALRARGLLPRESD